MLRLIDGRRKVTSIPEITGMEGEVITMQEIFCFRQTGVAADGTGRGPLPGHAACGRSSRERLRSFGILLPDAMFDPARQYQ